MLTRQQRRELRETLARLWCIDDTDWLDGADDPKQLRNNEAEALFAQIPPSPELTAFMANRERVRQLMAEDKKLTRAIVKQLGDFDA